jgi:CheY-like chemotaxis protein
MAEPVSVLLVDDSPAFLRTATFFLEQCGEMIVVGTVTDGQEALDRVHDLDPDVVLLDLVMPGMTGWQIIARLRVERPEIGIIAMSVWEIDSYREAALEAGADEFVSKAVISTELLPAIWRVMRVVQSRRKTSPAQATAEMMHQQEETPVTSRGPGLI